jgi:type VI secretion system protein ImpM
MPRQVVRDSAAVHPAAPIVGWYGKTPSTGDFISRRLSRSIIDRLDGWLQAGMTAIREASPDGWQRHYASAPVWDALLPAGIVAARMCVVAVAPSFDRVGRRFPFCVIVSLPPDKAALSRFTSLAEYGAGLSKVVEESIQDSIGADEIDQRLDALTAQCVQPSPPEIADLSDIAAVLGDAALDNALTTVPLNARSIFPWPDLVRTFEPSGATSYWWRVEPGRMQCGFTHEGALNTRLFSMLFGAPAGVEEPPRPPD